jgi:uncharacterized membrane protein YhhN
VAIIALITGLIGIVFAHRGKAFASRIQFTATFLFFPIVVIWSVVQFASWIPALIVSVAFLAITIGDFFLTFLGTKYLIQGLVSFLVAYSLLTVFNFSWVGSFHILYAVIPLILSGTLVFIIFRFLGPLRIPVIFYSLIQAAFLFSALMTGKIVYSIAVSLLYLTDAIIALNQFRFRWNKTTDTIGMTSYYFGLFLYTIQLVFSIG